MEFCEMRVKEIECAVRYTPSVLRFRAEGRREHIVGIQLSGRAVHDFGDRSALLGPNTLYFLNRKDDYSVTVLERGEAFSVHFTTYGEISTDSFFVPAGNTAETVRLLERIARSTVDARDALMAQSLLYRFLSELIGARERERGYAPRDERLLRAREHLEQHLADGDCLAAAIAVSGLTARRFGELFRLAFGSTPGRYLTERRIACAKRLLPLAGMTVSECASLCGFSDVYYFSRVFKTETGSSPVQWRAKNGQKLDNI